MKRFLMFVLIVLSSTQLYAWDEIKYKDAAGRTVGSSTTRSGKTTYKDRDGRKVMTAVTRSGKTTYKDRDGRTLGTATKRTRK